jgi:hypothetical protein
MIYSLLMKAYRYLIVLVPLLIFAYAGYYFSTSGGGQLLATAVTQDITGDEGVSVFQIFAGQYECEEADGCEHSVKILLLDDTTFELNYTDKESGEEIAVARGTWGVGQKNKLTLLVDRQASLSSVPNSLHGIIDTLKIKKFTDKKVLFSWMKNPTFTRTAN